jgi:hypothetical protein
MVLSQPDIRKAVEEGRIAFSPALEERQWSEASVDLRLGFSFAVLRKDLPGVKVSVADGLKTLGSADFWKTKGLKKAARGVMRGPSRKDGDYFEGDRPTQPTESRDWSGSRNEEGV